MNISISTLALGLSALLAPVATAVAQALQAAESAPQATSPMYGKILKIFPTRT